MDLSFEEKSAWGSALAIGIASWFFFPGAIAHLNAGGAPLALAGRAILVIGVIVVVEVLYHSIVALTSKDQSSDERDKLIGMRADRNSGYVLAVGVMAVIGHIIASGIVPQAPTALPNSIIAVYLLLALTVSEMSKLLWQVWYYRTGV